MVRSNFRHPAPRKDWARLNSRQKAKGATAVTARGTMDERIEAFLKDVVDLEGVDSNTVHEGVRAYLAVYEDMVRDEEPAP